MPFAETTETKSSRFSYLKKLIQDGDIPFDELYYLMLVHHQCKNIMSIFMGSNNLISSDFNSEAYLEYRSRVFQQLESEHDKENEKAVSIDEFISQPNKQFNKLHTSPYHTNVVGEATKNLSDFQPTWDDSDLQAETYTFAPSTNLPLQWEANQTNNCNSILKPEIAKNSQNITEKLPQNDSQMNWSVFDVNALPHNSTSEDLIVSNTDSYDNFNLRLQSRVDNSDAHNYSPHIQAQKLEREAVRCRLAFGADSDHENDELTSASDKSWLSSDRAFSVNSQSLHICYINESCSSDESDGEYPRSYRKTSTAFSPLASPFNSCSKTLEKRHKSSNSSSNTSRNSLDCSSLKSENSTERIKLDEARLSQAKRDELELEARFELAQAQQKAKILAEAEKKIEKLRLRSSLAQRLLSDTLPEETALKLKSYSLTKRDCRIMTVGQLQLILNDMHSKKQGLNEELVTQLIKRDELQTEQDARLTDIEDAKAMLGTVGPETTV